LNQLDFANAALHVHSDFVRSFSISVVAVVSVILVQTFGSDSANSAGCVRRHTDVFR
jgi:hypothetical protein